MATSRCRWAARPHCMGSMAMVACSGASGWQLELVIIASLTLAVMWYVGASSAGFTASARLPPPAGPTPSPSPSSCEGAAASTLAGCFPASVSDTDQSYSSMCYSMLGGQRVPGPAPTMLHTLPGRLIRVQAQREQRELRAEPRGDGRGERTLVISVHCLTLCSHCLSLPQSWPFATGVLQVRRFR